MMNMQKSMTGGAAPAATLDHHNLHLALKLAGAGMPVFPCLEADGLAHDKDGKPKGAKAPYTGGGFNDASTDTALIQSWWDKWPNAVPGMPTGEATGIAVIDGDLNRDTGEALGETQIADLGLDHPDAVKVRTQSGGVQILYRNVAGAGTGSKKVASKIDTRGAGGYIIAPGARMQDGATYRYERRTLSDALAAGNLPPYPLEAVEAAIKAETERKRAGNQGPKIDTGRCEGQTEATDAETMEVVRRLLAEAPNHLCREDWVKLALSLRVAYGESLREAFTTFSLGYMGGKPCTAQDAMHVWQSSGAAHTVTGIRPALALLRDAVGQPRFIGTYAEVYDETRPNAEKGGKRQSGEARGAGKPGAGTNPSDDKLPGIDLIKDIRGRTVWCAENACIVLEQSPAWAGVFAYDEFGGLTMLQKPIPGSTAPKSTFRPRPIADSDMTAVLRWFNRNGFPDGTRQTVTDAVDAVARANTFSPVQDYLQGLTWDGKPRAGAWLATYCGAAPSSLTDKQGQAWLISAVARALNPGCKADCALVLEGQQGAGKSSAISILAGDDWFYDGLHDLHSKDASAGLRGKWIIELPELSAMRRTETEGVKAFLSRTTERYRPAYGRCEVIEPRRCVFAGTTNRTDWLTDDTGGRRFWPVALGKVDLQALTRDRNQIWAEAVALYKSGAKWWLATEDEAEAAEVVALRAADDPWSADVLGIADGLAEVSTREIFQRLDFPKERWGKAETLRVAGILTRAGWTRAGKFTGGANRNLARYLPPA